MTARAKVADQSRQDKRGQSIHRQFLGVPCSSHSANGFSLGRWVSGGRKVKAHGHADAHFMYVQCDRYITTAAGSPARNGVHFIYNPPNTYHRDRLTSPGSFFTIALSPRLSDLLRSLSLPMVPTQIAHTESHTALGKVIREFSQWQPDSEFVAEALCLELLSVVANRKSVERRPPVWLRQARALLEDCYARAITVAEASREVGVHPVHLARTFRTFHGCTPGEFLRERRIARAAELLSKTDLPLVEIALATGFADQSHFTKQFRRATSIPPAAYRDLTA